MHHEILLGTKSFIVVLELETPLQHALHPALHAVFQAILQFALQPAKILR